nr:serine protease inhibitor isoform X2 [Ciona intestinalis]|eukprot:XP_026692527.1 serine protease inhibitor isoform X2 [Ciona intestinalis]
MDGLTIDQVELPPFEKPAARLVNNFAFKLLNEIASDNEDNVVFSPLSIFTSLATLRPALNGTSLEQLNDVTGLDTIRESDMNDMYDGIFKKSSSYKLKQASRIYVDRGIRLSRSYRTDLYRMKISRARRLDFRRAPEESRNKINKYVKKRTRKLIKELVPVGAISSATMMYLVNAIYLKAKWDIPFQKSLTRMRRFRVSNNESIRVETMISKNTFCTRVNNRDLQASVTVLSLGGSFSFVIMSPHSAGNFSRFYDDGVTTMQEKMTRAFNKIWTRRGNRQQQLCSVKLPKFKVDYAENIKEVLKGLGIRDIFSINADFSRLSVRNNRELYVSEARHSAVLSADEAGVEAAGATAFGISLRSTSLQVTVNKPFIFALRHDPSGALIFVGKIVRPSVG